MKTKSISVRLPLDLHAKVEKMADETRRSISNMVIVLLEEAFEARTPK